MRQSAADVRHLMTSATSNDAEHPPVADRKLGGSVRRLCCPTLGRLVTLKWSEEAMQEAIARNHKPDEATDPALLGAAVASIANSANSLQGGDTQCQFGKQRRAEC